MEDDQAGAARDDASGADGDVQAEIRTVAQAREREQRKACLQVLLGGGGGALSGARLQHGMCVGQHG